MISRIVPVAGAIAKRPAPRPSRAQAKAVGNSGQTVRHAAPPVWRLPRSSDGRDAAGRSRASKVPRKRSTCQGLLCAIEGVSRRDRRSLLSFTVGARLVRDSRGWTPCPAGNGRMVGGHPGAAGTAEGGDRMDSTLRPIESKRSTLCPAGRGWLARGEHPSPKVRNNLTQKVNGVGRRRVGPATGGKVWPAFGLIHDVKNRAVEQVPFDQNIVATKLAAVKESRRYGVRPAEPYAGFDGCALVQALAQYSMTSVTLTTRQASAMVPGIRFLGDREE